MLCSKCSKMSCSRCNVQDVMFKDMYKDMFKDMCVSKMNIPCFLLIMFCLFKIFMAYNTPVSFFLTKTTFPKLPLPITCVSSKLSSIIFPFDPSEVLLKCLFLTSEYLMSSFCFSCVNLCWCCSILFGFIFNSFGSRFALNVKNWRIVCEDNGFRYSNSFPCMPSFVSNFQIQISNCFCLDLIINKKHKQETTNETTKETRYIEKSDKKLSQ